MFLPFIEAISKKFKTPVTILAKKNTKVEMYFNNKEIVEEIQKIKGKFILTKKKHKTGTDRIFEAYKKINKKLNCEYIINLQGDEPFIDPKDIINLKKYYSVFTPKHPEKY